MSQGVTKGSCTLCGAMVSPEELHSGAAIHVGQDLVCPNCVEQLPVNAKVRINQLRALRGMDAVTYKFLRPAHPKLNCYTFSRSAEVAHHRRLLRSGRQLDAPVIGDKREMAAAASQANHGHKKNANTLLIAGIAAAVLLVIILPFILADNDPTDKSGYQSSNNPDKQQAQTQQTTQITATDAKPATYKRSQFPDDPITAWQEAVETLSANDQLLQTLAKEVIDLRSAQLHTAAAALERQEFIRCRDLLDRSKLDNHRLIAAVIDHERQVRRRLEQAEITKRQQAAEALRQEQALAAKLAAEKRAQEQQAQSRQAEQEQQELGQQSETQETEANTGATPPSVTGVTSYLATARELLGDQAKNNADWSKGSSGALILEEPIASLSRSITLAAGNYHIWVHIRGDAPKDGYINVTLAKQARLCNTVPAGRTWQWLRVGSTPIQIDQDGDYKLDCICQGVGWQIVRVMITNDPATKAPDASTAAPMPWTPAPAPAPPALITTKAKAAVLYPSLAANKQLIPADIFRASALIQRDLPGGVGPTVFGSRKVKGRRYTRNEAELALGAVDLTDGGLVLLLHPVRKDRQQIQVTLQDQAGIEWELPPLQIPNPTWLRFAITLPKAAPPKDFDPTAISKLILADPDNAGITTSFIIGKLAIVLRRAPAAEDLALSKRALLLPERDKLIALIERCTKARKGRNWYRDFAGNQVRILAGHQMLNSQLKAKLYDGLEAVLGERPPNLSVSALTMSNAWLDDTFIIPPQLIEPDHHHLILVMTGGVEFATGLNQQQALRNFWLKMIESCMASGVLPVVVLGPNRVDNQHVITAEALWADLLQLVRKQHPGVPVLDLRSVPAVAHDRFGPHGFEQCSRLLIDGYAELLHRIKMWQQEALKRR